jgi:hypothetical protein
MRWVVSVRVRSLTRRVEAGSRVGRGAVCSSGRAPLNPRGRTRDCLCICVQYMGGVRIAILHTLPGPRLTCSSGCLFPPIPLPLAAPRLASPPRSHFLAASCSLLPPLLLLSFALPPAASFALSYPPFYISLARFLPHSVQLMVVGNLIHDVDGNAAFNPGKKSYYRCATVATLAVTVVVTKA